MKLDAYIRQTGTTEQAIARLVGRSQGTINKLRNGKINPSLDLLNAVFRATNGAVTPNDFLPEADALTADDLAEQPSEAAG